MSSLLIGIAVFVAVTTFMGGVLLFFRKDEQELAEERLTAIANFSTTHMNGDGEKATLLQQPLDEFPNVLEEIFGKFINLPLFLEQANTEVSPKKFIFMTVVASSLLGVLGFLSPLGVLGSLLGFFLGVIGPFGYFFLRRRKRLKKFGAQLPEALELISRALRAGHSLGAGFKLVGEEMVAPISTEFTRAYEEQNYGITLEETLQSMANRIPNLDLQFFTTAVVLQRQTGGDLAEILDKISALIRERFKIMGMVQSLTGEGRLSGVVLLGLPPVLFVVMYRLNPGYCAVLWEDPLGQQLLAAALVLQGIGALVIKKIITIKV
ncbi:MAG: type II secretion system F family protein [Pirellulaceae bacterium]|nr:type II secretion system F family protein [Pirellulaceae bacterium]